MKTALLRLTAVFASLLLYGFMTAITLAAELRIEEQTLHYAVSYENLNVGELEVNIRHKNDGYVVTCNGKPNHLFKLLFNPPSSRTRFIRHRHTIVLASGSEQVDGRSDEVRSFSINRTHHRVEFSNGKHIAIQPDEQLEAAAFPLLLMLRSHDNITATPVREVSTKRIRDYMHEKPVAETVHIAAGTFSAWKISRYRIDRPQERVSVWLKQADNPIPLKIVLAKKGKLSILTLRENSIGG